MLSAVAFGLLSAVAAIAFYRMTPAGAGPADLAVWVAPHRYAWYALPATMIGFVVLALVPVVFLIAATGIAFGPVLGPVYAMAGCLASASAAFAVGRWLGHGRVERWGGSRLGQLTRAAARNGTLAVFLIRKVPAPFALVNLIIGASAIRYREFVIGTVLGMCAFVIALAGFGSQLADLWRHPSPSGILRAALYLSVPLTAAWLINRTLRRRFGERGAE